jgi:ribose transport system substrate-binding protein
MQCDAPQCAVVTKQLTDATAAVGWDLKVINFANSNPASLVSGLRQALEFHPTAVALVGLPVAVWGSVIPDYAKAGVAIVPLRVGDVTIDKTVVTNVSGSSDTELFGKIMANWFIADSGASGEAMLVGSPEIAPTKYYKQAFTDTVQAGCAKCKVTDVSIGLADVAAGKLPARVVSELQRHPNAKYVISSNISNSSGLSEALKAAGLTGVRLAGGSAESAAIANVNSGEIAAVTPTSLNFAVWYVADSAFRVAEGMTQLDSRSLPTMLITKDSNVTPTESFNYPADWQDQFKKLWNVG